MKNIFKRRDKTKEELAVQDERDAKEAADRLRAVKKTLGADVVRKGIIISANMDNPRLIKRLKKAGFRVTVKNLVRNINAGVMEVGKEVGLDEENFKVMAREAIKKAGLEVVEE